MVNRAERLRAAEGAQSDHRGVLRRIGCGRNEGSKPGGRDARHVAGQNGRPTTIGGPQCRLDAAQRTATSEIFIDRLEPEFAIAPGVSDNGRRAGSLSHLRGDMFDQRGPGIRQEGFVASHSDTLPAGQNETRHLHDTMVPVLSIFAGSGIAGRLRSIPAWFQARGRYNHKNIMSLFCLLLPVATALAGDAGVRMTSTIRVDNKTGRLVRKTVVAPATVDSTKLQPREVVARVVESSPSPASGPESRFLHNVDVNQVVEQTAKAHEVDPLLVHSVIKAESNYNPSAVSPKGAMGLMQLMPDTARRFGAQNTFDVRQNIEAGVKYLRYLQDMFGKNQLALAAYNAGEGAVLRYGNVPPYRETENYVYRVGKFYGDAVRKGRPRPAAVTPNQTAAAGQIAGEPLRQLEIARDAEGRIVLRTK